MAPTRTPPPTGEALDKQLKDAFGTEEDAAAWRQRLAEQPEQPWPAPKSLLHAALARFQAQVPAIPKNKIAKVHHKESGKLLYTYKYADLADVTAIVLPLLGKLGLTWTCVPTWMVLPGETQTRFVMAYELRHVDGESITGYWPIPDRSDPQAIGAALTYARRYALVAVVGVAADEDTDGTAAKDAAATRNETLDETSELSLPPDDADLIVAALEPHALTPLAEYPKLWALVTKRRAANKPSPVEHEGAFLTWGQLFGLSLAQRVDALRTPAECTAFWEAGKAAGGDQALPWQWEGKTSAARLVAHGTEIRAAQDRAIAVLEHTIEAATTLDELVDVRAAIDLAHEEWKIHDLKPTELLALVEKREEQIKNATGASAAPEPARSQHPLGFGEGAQLIEYTTWVGAPTATILGDIDGATERGEIDAKEAKLLQGMLNGRPEPVTGYSVAADNGEGLVPWLEWQIDTAANHANLDLVRDRIVNLHSEGLLEGGAADSQVQRLYSRIAARRRVQDGNRYGGRG